MSNKFKDNTVNSRPVRNRKFIKKVLVFCEGDTEYHYIVEAKGFQNVEFQITPIDMHGGGYKSFLSIIKKQPNDNCIMKFIIIDGDRISNDSKEKDNFLDLVKYCKIENKKNTFGERPYLIIVNNPNFEYTACLHSNLYKTQDIKKFIKDTLTHQDLDKFKSDKKVYDKLNNSNKNSYRNVLDAIAKRKLYIVKNEYEKLDPPQYIKFNNVIVNMGNLDKKCTNMDDFYNILM